MNNGLVRRGKFDRDKTHGMNTLQNKGKDCSDAFTKKQGNPWIVSDCRKLE
jgi:hypothetical protein